MLKEVLGRLINGEVYVSGGGGGLRKQLCEAHRSLYQAYYSGFPKETPEL